MVTPRVATLLFCTTCVVAVIVSCRGATQVVIEARTNVAHRSGLVTAFTVGTPDSIETAASTTETNEPWGADGFIGSLVAVPGGEKDGPIAVKIVMGVQREARDCIPPQYDGCIVARRKLRYIPHERLRLPIALYAQCEGVPCDQNTTCNALGQCVSATVDPDACTAPDGCTVPGDLPPDDVTPDAAPPLRDASTADDATDGDAERDASADAGTDAQPDAVAGATPKLVDCPGAPGGRCDLSTGVVCCFDAALKTGTCGSSCAPSGADDFSGIKRIQCDDDSDCQTGHACCRPLGAPITFCTESPCTAYRPICHATGACPTGAACTALSFQHYRTCQ